ncbi:hypothetical protein [Agrobacterium fabrum]|uniref:hypothetical protein n=1 Tax=Agrobacterium fabrum TaxID=1176649 RepID=UPI003BA05717
MTEIDKSGIAPFQHEFDLEIAVETEVDGVGMGVLTNGQPYLTMRGLARLCGLPNSVIVRIGEYWQDTPARPREQRIKQILVDQGVDPKRFFLAIQKDGSVHHAIPEVICMAVLEYYAIDAKSESKDHALKSFRTLARKGFSDFIYSQVGYSPKQGSNVAWQKFHDRVSLSYNTVPAGYFSVFKEMADIMVTLIREGADLGDKFVPDISVGIHWGKKWTAENLDAVYGMRMKYEHSYPDYFPQAASNPQLPNCYPDEALGEFRKWMREKYLAKHLPDYIGTKVKQGMIPGASAQLAVQALNRQATQLAKPIN